MIVITRGFFGIGRVFGMSHEFAIIIVNLREERLTVVLKADEVMLSPWIVAVVERIESLDLLDDRISHRVFKFGYSGRHHDAAAPKGLSERIVQGAYLRSSRIPIFAFSIIVTHCYLRRVTGEPFTRRSTRPRLPCQCIAAILLGSTGRGAARRTATGRDKPRQNTTSACRPRHGLSRAFHGEAARRMPP
jgi:hypothetical protein